MLGILLLAAVAVGCSGQGMFNHPTGCDRASCDLHVQWSPRGSDTIEFKLEGTAEGWVAVGMSADQVMGGNGIDDVFVCQRSAADDTVYAQDTYNPQSPRGNARDMNQDGFQMTSSSYDNGRIFCSFTRSIVAENMDEDRNLTESVYLFLAAGNTRGGPDVSITQHSIREPAADPVELIAPPGTFSFPDGCSRTACTAYTQWRLRGFDMIEFELEGAAEGWVAVGVSADQVMGGNGIDDVFVCQRSAANDTVYAQDTYNPQSPRGNARDTNQDGFQMTSSSYDNGRIFCTFSRSIVAENMDEDRNLTESVYLFLAIGSMRGGPDVSITQHSEQRAAAAPVFLTEGQSVLSACIDPLIRSHGILMYIAWIWLVPTAYFFAAFMKPAMPKKGAWFQVHRALMLIAIVPSLVGFILIFVAFRGSGNPNGLIVLGEQNPVGTAHMAFGLVVILLQLINPIISLCRCKPDAKYRWIFNWIHGKIIGRLVMIFAFTAVGLGTWRYSMLVYGPQTSMLYVFWIYIAFNIVYTIWDTFMYIYVWIAPFEKKEKTTTENTATFEMKPMKVDSDEGKDPPSKEPSKDAPLRYGFLVFHILLLVVPGLVIMLLIAIGCI